MAVRMNTAGGGLNEEVLTARTSDVLSNQVFYGVGSDELQVGTMPVQGGGTMSPQSYNQTVVNANRYVNGDIVLMGDGNFVESNIKNGVTIWGKTGNYKGLGNAPQNAVLPNYTFSTASLSNAVGTMPVQGGGTVSPQSYTQTVVNANRYVNGDIVLMGDGNFVESNIKKGVTMFGKVGTFEGAVDSDVVLYNKNVFHPWIGDKFKSTQSNNLGKISYEENYISIQGSIRTINAADLTGYNKLIASIQIGREINQLFYIGVGTDPDGKPENDPVKISSSNNLSSGMYSKIVDISSLNGSCYIGIGYSERYIGYFKLHYLKLLR